MSKSTKPEKSHVEIASEYAERAQEQFTTMMTLIAKVGKIRSAVAEGNEGEALEKIDALTKDILKQGNVSLAIASDLRSDERFTNEVVEADSADDGPVSLSFGQSRSA